MNNTVHNELAKKSYKIVEKLSNSKEDKVKKEFRSLSRSFPSMIQVNGLCCAIAFLFSKKEQNNDGKDKKGEKKEEQKENAYKILYGEIEGWLRISNNMLGEKEDLMDKITGLNNIETRLYTDEIMNLCLWLKRFAEGMLSD